MSRQGPIPEALEFLRGAEVILVLVMTPGQAELGFRRQKIGFGGFGAFGKTRSINSRKTSIAPGLSGPISRYLADES